MEHSNFKFQHEFRINDDVFELYMNKIGNFVVRACDKVTGSKEVLFFSNRDKLEEAYSEEFTIDEINSWVN